MGTDCGYILQQKYRSKHLLRCRPPHIPSGWYGPMGHLYRYGIYSNLGGSLGNSPNSWTRYLANGFVAVKIRFVICEKIENNVHVQRTVKAWRFQTVRNHRRMCRDSLPAGSRYQRYILLTQGKKIRGPARFYWPRDRVYRKFYGLRGIDSGLFYDSW